MKTITITEDDLPFIKTEIIPIETVLKTYKLTEDEIMKFCAGQPCEVAEAMLRLRSQLESECHTEKALG